MKRAMNAIESAVCISVASFAASAQPVLRCVSISSGTSSTATGTVISLGQPVIGRAQAGAVAMRLGIVPCLAGACYANCDGSTTAPVLNIADYTCFMNRFASGDSYANCDNSTQVPILNILDFVCFQARFGQGCP